MPYGNYSVSSLLSAARAAANKTASLNDSIAAYEFDLSPKDANAYQRYAGYLQGRLQSAQDMGDQSKVLDYSKKLTSAQRGYTSTEINRATTQVLYGNMSDSQKLQKMTDLYRQALENGDENLAQTVEMKAAILQQQMNRFSGGFGGRGDSESSATKKGYDAEIKSYKTALSELKSDFSKGRITSKDYSRAVGTIYAGDNGKPGLRSLIESASQDPRLSDSQMATFAKQFQDLDAQHSFQSQLQRANQYLSGATPTARWFNPQTGQYEQKDLKITGVEGGTNPYGLPTLKNTFSLPENTGVTSGRAVELDPITHTPVYRDAQGNVTTPGAPGSQLSTSGAGDQGSLNLYNTYKDNQYGYNQTTMYSPVTGQPLQYVQGDNKNETLDPRRLYPTKDAAGNALLPTDKDGKVKRAEWKAEDFGGGAGAYFQAPDIGGFVNKVSQNKYARDLTGKIGQLTSYLGLGNLANGTGILGNAGSLFGLGEMQKKVKELEGQAAVKRQQEAAALAQQVAQAQAALNAQRQSVVQQPILPANQAGNQPDARSIAVTNRGFTSDPFSRKGIGVNSLYRL